MLLAWAHLVADPGYWRSWGASLARVLCGFGAAMAAGIPLGLLLAVSRTTRHIVFPVLEVLRPIPPLAWVPASILFWPTQELSITFVTFVGAFFTIVLNVIGGARAIDRRFFDAARAMGASRWNIFRRVVLPATLPSIVVGAAGCFQAASPGRWSSRREMISGGGGQGGVLGGGMGFFIWNSYVGGAYEQIVVGMISIGIAGYACSEALRRLGGRVTPWLSPR